MSSVDVSAATADPTLENNSSTATTKVADRSGESLGERNNTGSSATPAPGPVGSPGPARPVVATPRFTG